MKIINNGKAYVQLKDFTHITEINNVPRTILESLIREHSQRKNEMNQDAFLKFTKEEEIEFFKSQDWIVDFKKVNDLSKEEFEYLLNANLIRRTAENLKFRKHQFDSLVEILEWKKGNRIIPFPLEIDTDKEILEQDEKFYARPAINPNILIIGKNDKTPIEEREFLTPSVVSSSISRSLQNIRQNNIYFTDFIVDRKFSKDRMYYLIEYHQKPYQEIQEQPLQKETKFGKLVKLLQKKKTNQ